MRRKNDIINHGNFRCCFCCHVRTGTVVLGIWHLILHVLALAILVSMLLRPELFHRLYGTSGTSGLSVDTADFSGSASVHFRSNIYNPEVSFKNMRDQDVHVALAITFCTGIITLLLLYGAIWGHPNYLTPFFCLQVFDFIISALTVIGYFSYMPDVRHIIEGSRDIPLQKELLRLDPQWLCTIVMLGFMACMMLKAYIMGVVWSCYKYLKLRQEAVILDLEADAEALLPPDYETATKLPAYIPIYAPPPYTPTSNTM